MLTANIQSIKCNDRRLTDDHWGHQHCAANADPWTRRRLTYGHPMGRRRVADAHSPTRCRLQNGHTVSLLGQTDPHTRCWPSYNPPDIGPPMGIRGGVRGKYAQPGYSEGGPQEPNVGSLMTIRQPDPRLPDGHSSTLAHRPTSAHGYYRALKASGG